MPAPLKFRRKVILVKIEPVYGVDAAPVGAADAMLFSNVQIRPFESEKVTRETVQAYLGSRQQLQVGTHVVFEGDIEMAGAGGAVDLPPAYAVCLRAAAHAETVTLATSVEYDPVSSGEEAATIHFHMDGQKHAILGNRGSAEWRVNTKQIPYIHFTFIGLYVAPVAAADPVPTLNGFKLPLTVGNTNTPIFTLHGYSGKLRSLTLTQGNAVNHIDLVGEESVQVTDRHTTGKIIIEAPPLGAKDYFAIAKAGTLGTLQVVHGSVAGAITQLDGTNVQILDPNYGEQDGRATLEMDLNFVPSSAGDDEYKYTTL